jgi:D-lactate dehydrogenase
VFYVGTNETDCLEELRRRLLRDAPSLPIVGEYIHRDAFALAARYGKDMFLAIKALGARRIPQLLRLESGIAALARRFGLDGAALMGRALVRLAGLCPDTCRRAWPISASVMSITSCSRSAGRRSRTRETC